MSMRQQGIKMNLHTLKNNAGSKTRRMRVGRGRASGKGKTCGRGHKGQMARKGANHKAGFEGGQMRLIRRIPKRGFKNPSRTEYVPVNLSSLAVFDAGADVTVEALRKAGLVKVRNAPVKILGYGELDNKLNVKASAFSESARRKIEAAGGTCEVIKG